MKRELAGDSSKASSSSTLADLSGTSPVTHLLHGVVFVGSSAHATYPFVHCVPPHIFVHPRPWWFVRLQRVASRLPLYGEVSRLS